MAEREKHPQNRADVTGRTLTHESSRNGGTDAGSRLKPLGRSLGLPSSASSPDRVLFTHLSPTHVPRPRRDQVDDESSHQPGDRDPRTGRNPEGQEHEPYNHQEQRQPCPSEQPQHLPSLPRTGSGIRAAIRSDAQTHITV